MASHLKYMKNMLIVNILGRYFNAVSPTYWVWGPIKILIEV